MFLNLKFIKSLIDQHKQTLTLEVWSLANMKQFENVSM